MKISDILTSLILFTGLTFSSSPAAAQSTRTWVSGIGDDANPCTRAAPCKTFAGAISRTVAGGEINCIDAGGFGVLMITKAISIRCTAGEAGIMSSSTDGIIINAAPSDQVILDGLDIEGMGAGLDGINIQAAGEVIITDCKIHQFSGNGVTIATSTLIRVIIHTTTISGNGKSGVVVSSSPGFGHVRIFDSMIHTNSSDGVQVSGAGNEALLSHDEILGNVRNLNVSTGVTGGLVYSLGNNTILNSSGDNPTLFPVR